MATPLAALLRWPVESQQRARRNALLASTALTAARVERDGVEEFLEVHAKRWQRAQALVEARNRARELGPTRAAELAAEPAPALRAAL